MFPCAKPCANTLSWSLVVILFLISEIIGFGIGLFRTNKFKSCSTSCLYVAFDETRFSLLLMNLGVATAFDGLLASEEEDEYSVELRGRFVLLMRFVVGVVV